MRILVTGGAGFIGRSVCALLAPDHELLVIDDLSTGRADVLPPGVPLLEIDLASVDVSKLASAVRDFDPEGVVHLAALCFIPDCIEDPGRTFAVNVQATDTLCRSLGDSNRKIVFTSTSDVYPVDNDVHHESDAPAPRNVYGFSKWLGEQVIEYATAMADDVSGVSLRLANVYGPGETNVYVIPEVLHRLETRNEAELSMGYLGGERDFVHVTDVAEAIKSVLFAGTGRYATYNVGTGISTSVRRVVEMLQELAGDERPLREDPKRFRKFDRETLSVDIGAIRADAGWSPRVTLAEGLGGLIEERRIGVPAADDSS